MHNHGFYVYLRGIGPLRDLPLAWFAYHRDAEEYVNRTVSPDYPMEIRYAANNKPLPTFATFAAHGRGLRNVNP